MGHACISLNRQLLLLLCEVTGLTSLNLLPTAGLISVHACALYACVYAYVYIAIDSYMILTYMWLGDTSISMFIHTMYIYTDI